ncbi:putative arylsulfatase protein [Fusarium flagelliforme]|uniref:Putative arylsulfatase protein n=1 Tax=Fusarium flagelliforme TaxID=2675880 RepID=A0A395M691_9HYPO|nr:putative arylsulfatase protein [Fusarium flagelliforme]
MYLSLAIAWTLTSLTIAGSSNPPPPPPPPLHHGSNKPNIIMIMTDDQDRLLGSTDYQKSLHREFFDKGVESVNHYITVAQCCPSRTAFLRGQHAHNTNVTHVRSPGGNYQKFWLSGESNDYLATWMQKAGYNIGQLPRESPTSILMTKCSTANFSDMAFRRRVQGLQGVDDIIDDLFETLETRNALDNTYIIYTADNGYHIGNFRLPPGKCLPYAEDTNVPFAVRGPGIPSGIKSQQPSSHIDLAATFIDITGSPKRDIPPFLDGRSLLSEWKSANKPSKNKDTGLASGTEIINVEYWGMASIEAPYDFRFVPGSTYKTLRIVSSRFSFLYIVWCTNQVEFYNTKKDNFEIQNLVNSTDPYYKRVMSRLNAVILVTKSCEQDSCRDPWLALQPAKGYKQITNLDQAMDQSLDGWFASFPKVHFSKCTDYQIASAEVPFWPASAQYGLGQAYRNSTDYYYSPEDQNQYVKGTNRTGTEAQRYATIKDLNKVAIPLTREQLGKDLIK